jgi:hypothetical protein
MTETDSEDLRQEESSTHQIAERMVLMEDPSGGFRLEPIAYQPRPFKPSTDLVIRDQSPRNARLVQYHREQHEECCKLWRECDRLDNRLKGVREHQGMGSPDNRLLKNVTHRRKRERAKKLSTLNRASTEISREQWLNMRKFANRTLNRSDKNILRAWFKSLDVDGSGNISIDELMDPLLSTGSVESAVQVRDIVKTMDINHDGELDFEELMRMFEGRTNKKKYGANFSGVIESLQMLMPPDTTATDDSTDPLLPMKVALGVARRRYLMNSIVKKDRKELKPLPPITAKTSLQQRKRKFSKDRRRRATQNYLCNTIGGIVERHMDQVRREATARQGL